MLASTLSAMAAVTSCSDSRSEVTQPQNHAAVIKTTVLSPQKIGGVLEIAAKVQADPTRVVHIYPPAGGRLLRVEVWPGEHVSKGQTVALEESSDVSQARSDYSKAQVDFDKNKRALDRAKLLLDHKVLSEREFEETQANAAASKSELDRAAERLHVMGVALNATSSEVALVAPRSGAVLDIGAASGEISKSTDNANAIATLADLSSVWIVGDVYEKDLSALHAGEPVQVTVSAYPGQTWEGKIANISDAVDPQTRTLKVRVVLVNPGEKLKPEMFATIHVQQPARDALVLPAAAMLHEGGDTSVMVETKPGQYERRLVTVKSASADQVVIATGLKPGEVVVTEGAALVRGGGEEQ